MVEIPKGGETIERRTEEEKKIVKVRKVLGTKRKIGDAPLQGVWKILA